MNIRFLSLTSAMALLAATAAFGQSPFPSVSGQQQAQQPSPFPSVSGQQPQKSSGFPSVSGQPQQRPASSFPSVGGAPPAQAAAPAPGGFPSVSGGAPAAGPAPMSPAMSPGMAMGAPGGVFGAPQQQQQPPCMDDFMKLRAETERRGKLIQAASKRKAQPAEACRLITSYIEADQKMISFVEANLKSCGIPPNIPADMKKNHTGVQQLRTRVCDAAQAQAQQPKGPSFSDVLGGATLPEADTTRRAGGSTFDTLSGNALSR